MNQADIGLVGMGVMGHSLVLNLSDHGYSVLGLDTDSEKIASLQSEVGEREVTFTTDATYFVAQLKLPRKIWLMVPAGKVVDLVIEQLLPLLSPGDLILDGGNSHFSDTQRRAEYLNEKSIHFLGVGVSGGEEGARFGPSIMPGGNAEAYPHIQPFLESIAAKVDGDPCVTYLGKGSVGHYVKMVHNGIEYSLMQLISEVYDLMHRGLHMDNHEMADVLETWNEGRLTSFLVEISRDILRKKDPMNHERSLVDQVLDTAKQKGTGKWTSQTALDLGIPIPTIDSAVMFRYLSARKEWRVKYAEQPASAAPAPAKAELLDHLEKALFASFIVGYAQGFELMQAASDEYHFQLDLKSAARIWRGGCIIRADLLDDIYSIFSENPQLENLIFSPEFKKTLFEARLSLIAVMRLGVFSQIAVPALSSVLSYIDAYFSERLPANMIQAQRDYFGAHTYQRTDQEGTFHTDWNESN